MDRIISAARAYVGQKEKARNSGFYSPGFEQAMRHSGWYAGAPWCGFFCRLVYMEAGCEIAYIPAGEKKDRPYVTGSAVKSMVEADKAGNWHAIAVPGSIAIWRNFAKGRPTDTGHMAIVTEVRDSHFLTIEGNTNPEGGREGYAVCEKTRSFKWMSTDGMRLMGFIHPKPLQ